MCRWFAYISPTEPCLLEDVLVSKLKTEGTNLREADLFPASEHSLSKQVHEHYLPLLLSHDPAVHAEHTTEAEITARNRLFNVDGFGMAWYTNARSTFSAPTLNPPLQPALYKAIQPPLHDLNFRSICANTQSKVLLAHIRAASSTAIASTNCHPFTFGIHTIMHNGVVANFSQIKRKMCEAMDHDAYTHIQGGTDTEHFAALLMTYLGAGQPAEAVKSQEEEEETPLAWQSYHTTEQMREALEKTIDTIKAIQAEVLGKDAEPSSLNVAVTDGKSFAACRYRNHSTQQPPSLYYSTVAGVTLNRQFPDHPDGDKAHQRKTQKGSTRRSNEAHGKHVIIASEPSTYRTQDWTLIEKNHMVLVGPDGELKVIKMED